MKRFALFLFAPCLLALSLLGAGPNDAFNLKEFAGLPVVFHGRHQPLDSAARNSLVQMRDRYSVYDRAERRTVPAHEWFAEVAMNPDAADKRRSFRIDHPDLISLLKLPQKDEANGEDGKNYSWNHIAPGFGQLEEQARRILQSKRDASQRTAFEGAVLKLRNALTLYLRLKNTVVPGNTTDLLADVARFRTVAAEFRAKSAEPDVRQRMVAEIVNWELLESFEAPLILPPTEILPGREGWSRVGSGVVSLAWGDQAGALFRTLQDLRKASASPEMAGSVALNSLRDHFNTLLDGAQDPAPTPGSMELWVKMAEAFRARDAAVFNATLAAYRQSLAVNPAVAADLGKAEREVFFNRLAPFYSTMPFYLIAFLLGCFFWFNFAEWTRKASFWLIVVAFVLHTVGLIFRMWLEGRPPVTNLYSSAIFIGWGSVGLGLLLERFWKNAIGLVCGSALGFVTLIIAHNLALGGDTLTMLVAVLDTNFWLATHVVIVTLGYASTYVAGFLAIIYIVRGAFTTGLTEPVAKSLSRMVYGIVCFATLFSFVGTVLGGIWADQSWGRFWGWDPKENGALIIVLWNALILHARWGGLVRGRGLMNLAIIGNVVTSWSWFGTNMLGIGLHSYGFTTGAFLWLGIFIISQLVLVGLGLLPENMWRSALPAGPATVPKAKGKPAAA
jgi:ABC-type transport system involved in cytochrome c biogenesis permease subunit